MRNITLFATYWNEIEWIGPSLEQIKRINPKRVVICDGCFDSSQENRSLDGTREKIKKFVDEYDGEAIFFEAKRINKWFSFKAILKSMVIDGGSAKLGDVYWTLRHYLKTNPYRINQAVTFSHMLSCANIQKGDWFMTYDADQFYSDTMIDGLSRLDDHALEFDLMFAKELTFFNDFESYTKDYESRVWNNMPHRLVDGARLHPTRDFKIKTSTFKVENYYDLVNKLNVGHYFHYKFKKDIHRIEAGYQLGDRKPPEENRTVANGRFNGEHPAVIRDVFFAKNELNIHQL